MRQEINISVPRVRGGGRRRRSPNKIIIKQAYRDYMNESNGATGKQTIQAMDNPIPKKDSE